MTRLPRVVQLEFEDAASPDRAVFTNEVNRYGSPYSLHVPPILDAEVMMVCVVARRSGDTLFRGTRKQVDAWLRSNQYRYQLGTASIYFFSPVAKPNPTPKPQDGWFKRIWSRLRGSDKVQDDQTTPPRADGLAPGYGQAVASQRAAVQVAHREAGGAAAVGESSSRPDGLVGAGVFAIEGHGARSSG